MGNKHLYVYLSIRTSCLGPVVYWDEVHFSFYAGVILYIMYTWKLYSPISYYAWSAQAVNALGISEAGVSALTFWGCMIYYVSMVVTLMQFPSDKFPNAPSDTNSTKIVVYNPIRSFQLCQQQWKSLIKVCSLLLWPHSMWSALVIWGPLPAGKISPQTGA
jgi:nicotinamide riboside transporter PnuC